MVAVANGVSDPEVRKKLSKPDGFSIDMSVTNRAGRGGKKLIHRFQPLPICRPEK